MIFAVVILFSGFMHKESCQSISNWLQYSFFDNNEISHGICIAYHNSKTVQMAYTCGAKLPSVECFEEAESK